MIRSIFLILCLSAAVDPPPNPAGRNPADTPRAATEGAAKVSWPQFRGPDGQGHSAATDLPTDWNARKNIRWRVAVRGRGWSSPVIGGDQVWLTTSYKASGSLRAVCFHRQTGKQLHDVEVFRKRPLGRIYRTNTHATPTPILDGNRLFVHFGAHGTACLSTDGKILWTAELPYYHHHGPAASPVLTGGMLVVPCDGYDEPRYLGHPLAGVDMLQFVAGLDAATGKVQWKRRRSKGRHAYCTPLVIDVDGSRQVVCPGGDRLISYDPRDGRELWWVDYTGYSLVPRPVFDGQLVFFCTGFDVPVMYAVKPDGKGDVSSTHVVWTHRPGVPLTSSPLLADGKLFFVSDTGVASCLDAGNGGVQWRHRLGGNFSASPICAGGNIYFVNDAGTTTVIAASPRFASVGVNRIRGRVYASPAVAGDAIFMRTDHALFCIATEAATP